MSRLVLFMALSLLVTISCSTEVRDASGESTLSINPSTTPIPPTSPPEDTRTPSGTEGVSEVEVDESRRHPLNVTVSVTSVQLEGRAIYVDIEAFSGAPRTIHLAGKGLGTILEDDEGNQYTFRPPADNSELSMEQGEELRARLAFLGPLVENAESLTLQLNYNIGLDKPYSKTSTTTDTPSFTFDGLPAPDSP